MEREVLERVGEKGDEWGGRGNGGGTVCRK